MKIIYMEHTIALINFRGASISIEDKDVQWKEDYVVLTDIKVEEQWKIT